MNERIFTFGPIGNESKVPTCALVPSTMVELSGVVHVDCRSFIAAFVEVGVDTDCLTTHDALNLFSGTVQTLSGCFVIKGNSLYWIRYIDLQYRTLVGCPTKVLLSKHCITHNQH